ncbi:hypothetical protein Btru_036245 [Bulinus truncatus]|nr:hypothetical protein Btru_036245 [Bulinus truncatus]
MATYSLGKLDAICARLKSTQQSQDAIITGCQGKKTSEKANGAWSNGDVPAGRHLESLCHAQSPDNILRSCLGNGQSDANKPKIIRETELIQPSPPEDKTFSIIPKINNNNVEATDYNEIGPSSSIHATFQTADSTTADSFVSSTTGDNSLTNHGGTWDTFISNLTVQKSMKAGPLGDASCSPKIFPPSSPIHSSEQPGPMCCPDNSAGNHDVTSSSPLILPSIKINNASISNDTLISAPSNETEGERQHIKGDISGSPSQKSEYNCKVKHVASHSGVQCPPEFMSQTADLTHSYRHAQLFHNIPSSGRRKSRKAAKPQRQTKDNVYFDPLDTEIDTSSASQSSILCENTLISKNTIEATDVTIKDAPLHTDSHAPMDLSVDNSPHRKNLTTESFQGLSDNRLISTDFASKTNLKEQENPLKETRKIPSSPLDLTDSKGLVDYAQNTMKELLGIYGFEGSEAKNELHQSFQDSAEEKSSYLLSNKTTHLQRNETDSPESDDKVDTNDETKSFVEETSSLNHSLITDNSDLNVPVNRKPLAQHSSLKALSNRRKPYSHKVINSSDFNKYIKRYGTGFDCGSKLCQDLGYKDHYHCMDCPHKVFIRKEEMLRHFKWHKKRQDSLQHGFMRYSPMDDCSKKYGNCTHNGRQTHYHCVQNGCDKVYVSTSDVQMHANFHRKDSAIIQEGFQRFRATEDCGTTQCVFYGQRTTHFHCRRPLCHFTFKNKADMEKHKSYHQKDEILSRDGFKKFMKYEVCQFSNCRYSKTSNHIHCIRPGCQYVLHSSTQLYSHKRKHERRDFEYAYRNFRHLQQLTVKTNLKTRKQDIDTLSVKTEPAPIESSIKMSSPALNAQPVQPLLGNSNQWLDAKIEKNEDVIDLPINLSQDRKSPTSEINAPSIKREVSLELEPEDLSMKKKMLNLTEPKLDVDSIKSEPVSLNSRELTSDLEAINCEIENGDEEDEDGDDIDDEDDEDDDDKDYGLFEEPTLVNILSGEQQIESSNQVHKNEENIIPDHETKKTSSIVGPVFCGENLAHCVKEGINSPAAMDAFIDPNLIINSKKRQLAAHKPASDRRERDESWKKYLIRYTANDACYSRCTCLYKDHYHCRVEGCQVIFKSKDGVRSHARFHDLQDSISPLVYRHFTVSTACNVADCQYDQKEDHYHCNWSNCSHTIASCAPTFARLEHYRIHEYAATYVGKSRNNLPGNRMELDPLHKRRGRPPKYPKYDLPFVPKVHLTEKEITDSTIAFMHNRCPENSKIINGFKKFVVPELCPDEKCLFRGKDHYHCGRKFCHMSTDRLDVLNVHAKEFHNNITILEGYEFFERMVNCRRPVCHNNRINRHFHCVRSKCDYSFVRHSTMAQHNKKHPTVTSAVLSTPLTRAAPISSVTNTKSAPSHYVPIAPAISTQSLSSPPVILKPMPNNYKNVIKSSGTFYPIPGLSKFKLTPVSSSSTSVSTSKGSVAKNHGISGQPITSVGKSILSPNGVCLTLSPIPLITHPPLAQQTNVLTGVIPIGTLPHQNLPPPLVNISGNQFLTAAQGQYLPSNEFLGSNIFHLVQSATSSASSNSSGAVNLSNQTNNVVLHPKQETSSSWPTLKKSMSFSVQHSCGRPFCKLKKKDHYHCLDCNQAFSDPARLRGHLSKHGFKFQKSDDSKKTVIAPKGLDLKIASKVNVSKEVTSEDTEDLVNLSLNLQPSVFTNMVTSPLNNENILASNGTCGLAESRILEESKTKKCQVDIDESFINSPSLTIDDSLDESNESSLNASSSSLTLCSSLSSQKSACKRSLDQNVDPDTSPEPAKQRKSNYQESKTDELPGGYKKVRCGEDCGHVRCAYRQTVTHYHCIRADCGYGFSDKSRVMQHRVRHERLDALMGNEFQQFRASVSCEWPNCEFNERASHFHCLKCLYSCADSSKVPAHRKYHAKLENISNNGFLKFSGASDCQIATCSYFRKQTHYHCTFLGCKHAVLGPSQMAAHKQKHGL